MINRSKVFDASCDFSRPARSRSRSHR